MNDKMLDLLLKQALTDEIADYEIGLNLKRKEENHMKLSRIMKPVIVVATCAALILTTNAGYHSWNELHHNSSKLLNNITNSFSIVVNAAQRTKLESGKIFTLLSEKKENSSIWEGDDKSKEIQYVIDCPIQCEGNNIDTITYEINKGAFQIIEPQNSSILLDGKKYQGKLNFGNTIPNGLNAYNEEYYTSFTISADKQFEGKHKVSVCNQVKASDAVYKKIWGKSSLQELEQGRNEIFGNLIITCTVKYKDGTSEKANIKVGNKISTLVKEHISQPKKNVEYETVCTTFEME